jgi:hypothetical protein
VASFGDLVWNDPRSAMRVSGFIARDVGKNELIWGAQEGIFMAQIFSDQETPVRQAFWVMRFVFTIAPILAGLDKFFHVLVDWNRYLAPIIPQTLHISAGTFMQGVGVVEIIAGLIVAFWPMVGGWIVAVWLWGIIVNLLIIPGYYDIALRDFGLSLGSVSLARLATAFAVSGRRDVAEVETRRRAA